jgi:hypothetical protein
MNARPQIPWLVFALFLSLAACSTPNYGLKPAPASIQSSFTDGDVEYINATGSVANLSVAADVDGFLKSKYIVVVLVLSNTSNSTRAHLDTAPIMEL